MPYAPITKSMESWTVLPNLLDYEQERESGVWERARGSLDGLPGGGLNIAHEAVVRHAAGPLRDHLALRWLGKAGYVRDFTFGDLDALSSRFSNVLERLGVGKGDVVCVLAGRIPELYIAALGTLKGRSVFSPLFSAFGPEPIRTRLSLARAKALVTTESLYARKVVGLRDSLPDLEHVILVGDDHGPTSVPGADDIAAGGDRRRCPPRGGAARGSRPGRQGRPRRRGPSSQPGPSTPRRSSPVASPSSTSSTVRPAGSSGGAAACRRSSRSAACFRAASTIPATISAGSPPSACRYPPPPGVTAPTPYSGCHGCPTLRTQSTSSGAPSAEATSAAVTTPPRASPTTRRPGLCSCEHRLVEPDSGEVLWDARPVQLQDRLRFGYMPEERGLYPRMAVAEQVAYFGRLHGMDAEQARTAAQAWLERLGLAGRATAKLEGLSHGNAQRA
jgi:hypothetical protein